MPSMLVTEVIDGGLVSFVRSKTGVAASVPVPQIGQTLGLEDTSKDVMPESRFVVQVVTCQSGLWSLQYAEVRPADDFQIIRQAGVGNGEVVVGGIG